MSLTRRLTASLKALLIVTVTLVTAELFIRIEERVTWGAPLLGPFDNEHLLVQDSLGVHGRPGYRFEKWRMNNLGFRGADITPLPAADAIRIAILGASETFGLHESEMHEYPVQLQAILDSVAPERFEVVNAGLPGLSLASMVPYFRRVVAPIRPRYVFIYPSPSFYLEVNPLPVVFNPPEGAPADGKSLGSGVGRLRIAGKAREVLKQLVPPALVGAYRERSLEWLREGHPNGWVWDSIPDDRMDLLASHLERLIPTIQAAGVTPVLVTHTNRFTGMSAEEIRTDRRHLVNLMAAYYPRASEAVMVSVDSAANMVIRNAGARYGVSVVEAEGRIAPGTENFADYAHFTDAGARAMASILAEAVLRFSARDTLANVGNRGDVR